MKNILVYLVDQARDGSFYIYYLDGGERTVIDEEIWSLEEALGICEKLNGIVSTLIQPILFDK